MKITDEILSYLEDEESRFIYQKRVQACETGNYDYIREIVDRYVPSLRPYDSGIENQKFDALMNKKIIIFGVGLRGRTALNLES